MSKILILNQTTTASPYTIVDYLTKHTWTLNSHPDVKVIHYYGGYDINHNPIDKFPVVPRGEIQLIDNNILVCGTNDVLGDYFDPRGEKMIMAIEYCLKHFEFDFLFRMSNTSYIHIPTLHRVLSESPTEKIHDGSRNLYNSEIPFIAGYNSYMSRDVAEVLIQNKDMYLESRYPEDLALGYVIFYKLKYASFDERPGRITAAWAFEEGFKAENYINVSDVFNYKFRPHTLEKYIQFHEYVSSLKYKNIIL